MSAASAMQNADNYDPSEIMAVCESILEDGEISSDEIYALADWLNNHREACFHWPGNLLVKPLQEVWSDGKVTKTELRKIGRILIAIRRAWAKQQAEVALEGAADRAAEIVQAFDLRQPLMPSIPIIVSVKSHSAPGLIYDVDLTGPSCTCPDWRSCRSALPPSNLTRCCKHVFDAYGQIEPETGWPGWLGAFLELAWTPNPQQTWMVFDVRRNLVLASTAGPTGWANVYAENSAGYDRFGYNVLEDRWAYSIEPPGSEAIARAIVDRGRS